jgi:hypothetical protein
MNIFLSEIRLLPNTLLCYIRLTTLHVVLVKVLLTEPYGGCGGWCGWWSLQVERG